ncbi:unnamed protein product [Ilex paraguariensis]|uniref:Uncharacterized protein n=1 Tax=Ilex paraguariensis TaxID=185542 RepID=A0ABC8S1B3_9AQUA
MIEGPLAFTVTPETVKSVRFCNRLSQTPVSLLRLLVQVKDRKLEVSSGGKRIGEMGQLMNFKSLREERDLRAVMDNATSSEHFERRRETRWRKGLEESQVVALWRGVGGAQGSLEVGTLRDWRALSCFGSRVEVEVEEGEDGVVGVGEVNGAGDGSGVGFGEVVGVGVEGGLVGFVEVVGVGAEGGLVGFGEVVGVGAEGGLVGEMDVFVVVVVVVVDGGEREEVRVVMVVEESRRRREILVRRKRWSGAIAASERQFTVKTVIENCELKKKMKSLRVKEKTSLTTSFAAVC